MMSFLVGQPVPAEYVPMMLEEMALEGRSARDFHWDRDVPARVKQGFHVLVIGAGMSGLLAAIRLEEAGIPYTVIEKNHRAWGAPGSRTPTPAAAWTSPTTSTAIRSSPITTGRSSSPNTQELRDYFERCASDHGVRKRIRFETEVVSARFDESRSDWKVRVRTRQGAEEILTANALISAVGQLNRPKLPAIPGIESFQGPAFHSARWEHRHPLEGKRVAVIGTGASALQLVPEVAKQAEKLLVFQRSPAWMVPNPELPPARQRRDEVAAEAPALLRPLVSLPALLAGIGRAAAVPDRRPGVAAPGALGQRAERADARAVHRLHEATGGRRPGAAGQGRAALSALRQAHAPGQRELARRAQAPERGARHRRHPGDHAGCRGLRERRASSRSI